MIPFNSMQVLIGDAGMKGDNRSQLRYLDYLAAIHR